MLKRVQYNNVMKQLKLCINTSNSDKVIITLCDGEKIVEKSQENIVRKNEKILLLIENILRENSKEISDLTALEVTTSGDSFTSTRVGISIANALSYALKIPINNLPLGKFVPQGHYLHRSVVDATYSS